jgi:hypothetical protein
MASFARPPPPQLEIPVKEIADKVYKYWNECGSGNIKFILYVLKHLKPILLTDGLPNKLYKNFLRHFTFTYLRYDKKFITSLFQTALEENAITGVIRIVRNYTDKLHLEEVLHVKEPVFTDYLLLDKLIELSEIVPQILMDSKINTETDAVLSNSIIIFLNMARPPIAAHIQCPLNAPAAVAAPIDAISIEADSLDTIHLNDGNPSSKRRKHNPPKSTQAWSTGGTRKRRRKSKAPCRRKTRYIRQ